MSQTLSAVFPVFALIFLGFGVARLGVLGPNAIDSLNRFVVYLALPAVLFRSMAAITPEQASQHGYLYASVLAIALVYLLAWFCARRQSKDINTIALEALSASYANSGYMGLPLCIMLFGPDSIPAVALAILMTACLLFACTLAIMEFSRNRHGSIWSTAKKVGLSLAKNPLVIAPIAGGCYALLGFTLPPAIDRTAELLSLAASPCALVCIGLFLAQPQQAGPVPKHTLGRILALKLFLHPLITAVLVFWVFDMDPLWAKVAILLAALPIGTGPFMLATLFERDAAVVSKAILYSTLVSILSVSLIAKWL